MRWAVVKEMNEMDYGLKEISYMEYGLKEMGWNRSSEVDNVTRVEVRLSGDVMMWCKWAWCILNNMYGVKWKVKFVKSKTEETDG